HLVGIDDAARLGEERGGLDIGCQHLTVAVDDVGTRSGDAAGRRTGFLGVQHAEIDEPAGDCRIEAEEDRHRHDDAVLLLAAGRLAGAFEDDRAGGVGRFPASAQQSNHRTTPPVTILSCPAGAPPLSAMPPRCWLERSSMVSGLAGSSSRPMIWLASSGCSASWS